MGAVDSGHIVAGNLGGAMIFVVASLLLIPMAFTLTTTAKLLAARASSDGRRELSDAVFLVVGITLSTVGVVIRAGIVGRPGRDI